MGRIGSLIGGLAVIGGLAGVIVSQNNKEMNVHPLMVADMNHDGKPDALSIRPVLIDETKSLITVGYHAGVLDEPNPDGSLRVKRGYNLLERGVYVGRMHDGAVRRDYSFSTSPEGLLVVHVRDAFPDFPMANEYSAVTFVKIPE